MRKNHMSRGEKILVACVVLSFALMLALMVLTIAMNSAASGTLYSDPPFALSSLLSDMEDEAVAASPSDYVYPAFIGISPDPEGIGISVGDNVVRELYTMLSPCLADGLMASPIEDTDVNWEMASRSKRAVYIRYHSALPVMVLQGAAASLCGGVEKVDDETVMPVREMILLLPDEHYGDCQIYVQDLEGTIWRYLCDGRREYPTLASVTAFSNSFSGSFFRFKLGAEGCGDTEPVFLERLRVRNMLLTPDSAVMIQENRNHFKKLLRQFDFNPDKLSTHDENDGTQVTVESHGIFRMQSNRFIYTAGADGGIRLENFVGYKERYTPMDGLRAACTIVQNLRNIHTYYLGGDGELILTEIYVIDGILQIVFRYAFDNLLLDGCEPALIVQVANERVMLADMYTISIRSLGDFDTGYLETGVLAGIAETDALYTDVTLTYPTDFESNGIYPVWVLYRKQ